MDVIFIYAHKIYAIDSNRLLYRSDKKKTQRWRKNDRKKEKKKKRRTKREMYNDITTYLFDFECINGKYRRIFTES